MKKLLIFFAICTMLTFGANHMAFTQEVKSQEQATQQKGDEKVKSIYDFTVKNIMGLDTNLSDYQGDVIMVVNTASKCGFTKQYGGLQELYDQYKDQGFVILGFPANNFMKQEPGTNEEIKQFCQINYGVTFPMFAKISVKGDDQHPLYKFLTDKKTNPEYGGKITWNFNKFLIGRDGKIINRFGSRTKPKDDKVITAIEEALKQEIPETEKSK